MLKELSLRTDGQLLLKQLRDHYRKPKAVPAKRPQKVSPPASINLSVKQAHRRGSKH